MQNKFTQKYSNDKTTFAWQLYGLTSDPFADTFERKTAYLSPQWDQLYDLIYESFTTINSLLTISGPQGVGKTRFMSLFCDQLADSFTTAQATVEVTWDNKTLLKTLYQQFDIKKQLNDDLTEELESIVTNLQYSKKPHVLVIDNAENLSEDILKSLLFMLEQQSNSQMHFHVLLIGSPAIESHLAELTDERFSPELVHHLHLEAFNHEETTGYIHHRLAQAGRTSSTLLSNSDLKYIQKKSKGMPIKVNTIAGSVLRKRLKAQHIAPRQTFNNTKLKLYGGMVTVSVIAALAFLLTQGFNTPSIANTVEKPVRDVINLPAKASVTPLKTSTTATAQNVIQSKHVLPQQDHNQTVSYDPKHQSTTSTNIATIKAETFGNNINNKIELVNPQYQQEIANAKKLVDELSTIKTTVTAKPKQASIENARVKATIPKQPEPVNVISMQRIDLDIQSPATKELVNKVATKKPSIKIQAPKKVSEAQVATKSANIKNAQQVNPHSSHPVHHKPAKITSIKLPITHPDVSHRLSFADSEKEILQINKKDFTLQVLAINTKDALEKFINKHQLTDHIYYYHRVSHDHDLKQKDAYILLYGKFASYDEAIKASKELPLDLQKKKPWARNISSIQYDIRQNG